MNLFTREDFVELRKRYKTWRKDMRERPEQMEVDDEKASFMHRYYEPKRERYPKVPWNTFREWVFDIKRPNVLDTEPDVEGVEGKGMNDQTLKELHRTLDHIKHLRHIDVEAFIRYHEIDNNIRFDVQYCEYQKRMAIDSLALFAYIPFVFLFAYFLVQGKGLGVGYWMNNNIDDFFLGQEFDNSDDLRFVKTYWDIGSEGEFWEFVEGPLLGGLWSGDDGSSNAHELVQSALMPVGALKMRQLRVQSRECPEQQTRLFSNNVEELLNMPGGVEYIRSRQMDFSPVCFPELHFKHHGVCIDTEGCPKVDKGPYAITSSLHDGVVKYSMNDPRNPSGWAGSLQNTTSLPPMFIDRVYYDNNTGILPEERYVLDAYQYHSCSEFNSSDGIYLLGKLGPYSCDGHGMVLPFNWTKDKASQAIGIMKNGIQMTHTDENGRTIQKKVPWIDAQTRAISFDLIFYCKNVNLFSFSQFLVEVTATGTWIPVKQFISFQMFDSDSHNTVYFFFVAVYYLYITIYIFSWVHSFVSEVQRHVKGEWGLGTTLKAVWASFGFWVAFDFVNLSLFITAWYFTALSWDTQLKSVLQTSYYPDGYEEIAWQGQMGAFVSAGNGLFTFCRIFYFLQLHPQLNLLTKTVQKASSDLFGIVIIFIIVFIAFSLVAFVVYGLALEDFRDFPQTVISLCRMLLGDFDFKELLIERRIMTPIIFALYNALAVFILLNMVIAILDDAFGKVQEEKYTPSKLLALMSNSDDPEFDTQGSQNKKHIVVRFLSSNPLMKELMWWFRRSYLQFLLISGQYDESDEVWQAKKRSTDRRNPRIYWSMRLDDMRDNMQTYPFTDKCRLISRQLDDILMDHFGNDFKLLVDSLVWEPAMYMHREPSKLLRSVLQFHHFWKREVEAVTQTGKTVKEQQEQQEKELEQKMRQMFLRQQEKYKEESRQDTFRRLRLKYGRDPTTEELMNEMAAMPPDNKQDIEKWWMYQTRRLHQITETFTKLAETRDRNFSGGGPKLKFTEWMIEKVSKTTQRHLTESMGGIVQEEIQEEMTCGDKDSKPEDRETMPSVLKKWRDGYYDELKRRGKLNHFEEAISTVSSTRASTMHHEGLSPRAAQSPKGAQSPRAAASPSHGSRRPAPLRVPRGTPRDPKGTPRAGSPMSPPPSKKPSSPMRPLSPSRGGLSPRSPKTPMSLS
eukprot:TRINITY_DN1849_c0_g1_i3.p1 TRINITY_DN1849_c0_g1~~TRINITY_DN1849_c0_g1_i3.p1  ORF type:complete len:1183 (+),score=217.19 TRINITY_DN1849_c0_g1_i3:57-3605(+)